MEYLPLYSPGSQSESAFIESLLMDNGIHYYINNEILSRLYVPQGPWRRAIYVQTKDYLRARELLKDILKDEPIPEYISERISKEETAPAGMSAVDREQSRYRLYTICLLAAFVLYMLYKIATGG